MDGGKFCFAIDRGGTFTDVYARCPGGKVRIMKLLSEDPQHYKDAPTEGIRRIIEQEAGIVLSPKEPLDTRHIDWIRMGTTVATNALLERKGERMALAITAGLRDLLFIGNQSRPNIFDLTVRCPEVLYEDVVEVEERVVLAQEEKCQAEKQSSTCHKTAVGITGERVEIWKPVNVEKLRDDLKRVLSKGIKSIAVVLAHSYTFIQHEVLVGEIAEELGFTHVSLSSQVMPMVKMVPRGYTASADAYLTPHVKRYVSGFASGFKDNLKGTSVLFMQSDGGLTPMSQFNGSRAILSGPAGGVVGHAMTTYGKITNQPIIGFDMGGTSTDVSRYDGSYEHVFESTTAGVTIQAPQLDVNTVAAGGGSVLFYRSGMFVVGPDSAGSNPGPACYRKGGPLTVTDANLCLGRLLPEYFPNIFGPNHDEPLDRESTMAHFGKLAEKFSAISEKSMSVEQVALGFLRVANEAMCRPIRALTQSKGHDTSRHTLTCFGGAGGQHACTIARILGMKTIFIHRYAGILSAYGMALANVVHESQEPCAKIYSPESFAYIDERLEYLTSCCVDSLTKQGFSRSQIVTEPYLHLRYEKTDCALMCVPVTNTAHAGTTSSYPKHGDFLGAFLERYRKEFGFSISGRPVIVDDIRVRGVARCISLSEEEIAKGDDAPPVEKVVPCYFDEGFLNTNVYLLEKLGAGHQINGPAIIINQTSTILIEPFCVAKITNHGDVVITVGSGHLKPVGTELDTIQLSIFSHRFMSIAEQMGRILQQTSMSTNIKERLDFSCALFGPDGGLVSNAPHIPVHLGAMQEAVQFQLRHLKDDIHDGDVILSNHPQAGGSHLPDLTVITPVFYDKSAKPEFFVASRGHHADIGGITPGSMPPHSKSLAEEGATFISFKLVRNGTFQEEAVTEMLMAPSQLPNSSGTRMLQDNLSDLRAQVAANQKGIALVTELIAGYGLQVVQAYMAHIQNNAELAVRDMLREVARRTKGENEVADVCLSAEDFMDDGTRIKLNVTIDRIKGNAIFDFSGTGYEVYGNCNAPRAVSISAVIYCLRSMIGHDIPLNQGCLNPIQIQIPPGSILDPSENAAVVGGNVLTSQRVVDVIFRAFGACAASQGCMNNITFGDEDTGYYETVAGGAGAGPGWHGRSGVHSHMTNTRITDPEILERRYPVVLEKFQIRSGSGGSGKYHGGEGVLRQLLFRRPLVLSVLTERRVFKPYGLNGGGDGCCGTNLLQYASGRTINLGAKTAVPVNEGDRFKLSTPGGGGYGADNEDNSVVTGLNLASKDGDKVFIERGSVHEYRSMQESA